MARGKRAGVDNTPAAAGSDTFSQGADMFLFYREVDSIFLYIALGIALLARFVYARHYAGAARCLLREVPLSRVVPHIVPAYAASVRSLRAVVPRVNSVALRAVALSLLPYAECMIPLHGGKTERPEQEAAVLRRRFVVTPASAVLRRCGARRRSRRRQRREAQDRRVTQRGVTTCAALAFDIRTTSVITDQADSQPIIPLR